MSNKMYMVFDCESVGLHGEAFAVGFVVIDSGGFELDSGLYSCSLHHAIGSQFGREWVTLNCLGKFDITHSNPSEVREMFWKKWQEWKSNGAMLVTDCGWPVEARFLARCVDADPIEREWLGPYPLHDVASMLLTLGKDPLAKLERKNNELPEHNPLADARQSARILLDCLHDLRTTTTSH